MHSAKPMVALWKLGQYMPILRSIFHNYSCVTSLNFSSFALNHRTLIRQSTKGARYFATQNFPKTKDFVDNSCPTPMSSITKAVSDTFIDERSAVIRYFPTEERFQLKLIHDGKVFNFDRAVTDPIESVIARITTNISKKLKNWNGSVTLMAISDNNTTEDICDTTEPIINVLNKITNGFRLNIKISEEIYKVAVNPPEIISIKFLKQAFVGFPIIPYKLEASSNFNQELSKYSWEYTMNNKNEKSSQNQKNKKKQKNNSISNDEKSSVVVDDENWKSTGCNSYIFTPTKEHIGARLRLTCTPCDGKYFGLSFSEEVSEKVVETPVSNPVYLERISRMKNITDEDFFRVVSYNCLADCYATPEWFISSPKLSLPADYRLPFLCKELFEYGADIYCLQEIDSKYFEKIFTPFLKHSMDFDGRFSCKIGNMKEGVATFFNRKKLQLIRNETIVVMEHMKTMSFWSHLNSLNEAFSARLEDRNNSNSILIVANTHLYFHPDADHIRLLQTITCVDYIENVATSVEEKFPGYDVNVLFCGDFNCTPPFSSYRFLTSGKVNDDDFDWTSHPTEKIVSIEGNHSLQFKNAHSTEQLTNITTCFEGCIDYILYQPKSFQLLNSYSPPNKELLTSILGLSESRQVSFPNFHAPSDHLPIIADFKLIL